MNRTSVLTRLHGVRVVSRERRGSPRALPRTRADARQRRGKVLVVAGWIVAVVGVVVYCAASFAAEPSADLAAIVFEGAAPAARGGLLVIGVGTLTWIVGSILHTIAMLDSDVVEPGEESGRSGTERRGS
jgi:hypothetical protein